MRQAMMTSGSLLAIILFAVSARAQDTEADRSEQTGGRTESAPMEEMAKAVTSMAQMCETMMQAEMKHYPLKLIAVSIIGGLLTLALALFVVLEIEWIRYWHRRLKADKP